MTSTTSLSRYAIVLSLFAAACGGSDSKGGTTTGPGAGGSAAGGAAGGSGDPAGTGGSGTASGGSGTSGSTSSGGSTPSGGSTSTGGARDGGVITPDDGGIVTGDAAVPSGPCRTNADCADVPGNLLCDVASGKCIACHTNAQCAAKEECVDALCVKLPACENSLDCANAAGGKTICDKTNGVCVQCTATADCGKDKECTGRVCRASCSSDNDCTAQHMLCNKGFEFGGQCTECTASSDCDSGKYCESGACVPQTCTPTKRSCDGDLIVQCNETGSGTTPTTPCTLALFSSCIVDGDDAKCGSPCENGKKDGFETDVDCGGPACPRCESAKKCNLPTDCTSNKCDSSKCQ